MPVRFRIPLCIAAAALLAACADEPTVSMGARAPLLSSAPHAEVIPDHYIVVFRDDVGDAPGLAARLVAEHGGELHYTYRSAIKGFAARLPARAVEGLRRNPHVAYIEPDQVARPTSATQTSAPWALDRIDQRDGLNTYYTYSSTGQGVLVFVIDSGINTTLPEFGGRAVNGYDACYYQCNSGDGIGHGTRVAGLVGSNTYGVAKGATIVSIRVFRNYQSGVTEFATASTIAMGVDTVTRWKRKNPTVPMVANVSSGVAPSQSLDDAVRASIAAGVTYVIGAGNDSANACNYSPGRVSEAITVGATDKIDYVWPRSNYGSCVDLYAPGHMVRTTSRDTTISQVSGTSYAAPHVAGFAARYIQLYPGTSPSDVQAAVIYYTTRDRIIGLGAGSYNRLLYTNTTSGRIPGCCL